LLIRFRLVWAIAWLAVAIGVTPSLAIAAVAFDAFGEGAQSSLPASPYTLSITLGAGPKGVMVRCLRQDTIPISIDSVTVGTDGLSLVSGSSVVLSPLRAETWAGATSLVGAQTVTVTFSGGNPTTLLCDAISATGVNAASPVNGGANNSNAGSPISLAVTSASGDLTSTAVYHDGTGAPTTNQTIRWEDHSINVGAGDTGPGTVNPTHTWTTGGVNWTKAVVTGANFNQFIGGYILTEAGDCINGEDGSRLITEDVSAGVGPCVAVAGGPPMRTLMGVGQ
jgi:hypothetical protein